MPPPDNKPVLYVCGSCNYAWDIHLEQNKPIMTICPQCDMEWYVKVDTWALSPNGNKEA